jgi:hypothetical protein
LEVPSVDTVYQHVKALGFTGTKERAIKSFGDSVEKKTFFEDHPRVLHDRVLLYHIQGVFLHSGNNQCYRFKQFCLLLARTNPKILVENRDVFFKIHRPALAIDEVDLGKAWSICYKRRGFNLFRNDTEIINVCITQEL